MEKPKLVSFTYPGLPDVAPGTVVLSPTSFNLVQSRHHSPTHPTTTHRSPAHPTTTHRSPTHTTTTHRSPTHPATTHRSPTHPATTHRAPTHPTTTHRSQTHPTTTHRSPTRCGSKTSGSLDVYSSSTAAVLSSDNLTHRRLEVQREDRNTTVVRGIGRAICSSNLELRESQHGINDLVNANSQLKGRETDQRVSSPVDSSLDVTTAISSTSSSVQINSLLNPPPPPPARSSPAVATSHYPALLISLSDNTTASVISPSLSHNHQLHPPHQPAQQSAASRATRHSDSSSDLDAAADTSYTRAHTSHHPHSHAVRHAGDYGSVASGASTSPAVGTTSDATGTAAATGRETQHGRTRQGARLLHIMNSRYRDTSNTAGEEDTRSRASRILPHASGSPRFGGRRLFGVLSNSRPRATFVPGGFPEEIFTDLKPHELSNYECCICYQVVCEPRECENDHMFCTACIDMWSCQSSSECRNRCPVCRAPAAGYKPSSRDAWSVLSARRVRCVEQRCSWSGQLKDYRRHLRNKHQIYMYSNTVNGVSTTRRSQPNFPVTSSLSTAGFLPVTSLSRPTMSHGWQRLESLMDAFTDQLEHRRQNVERAYQEQERARQERLEEVESLSRQLGKVASDLTVLISNMSKDTQRYKSYINTPAVTDNKQQHQQALVGDDTHESTVAHVMLPDINT